MLGYRMKSKKTEIDHALPLFGIMPDGELFRACALLNGTLTPLASPYGDKMERRAACREASNALYRHLCLGHTERTTGEKTIVGLSPDFKITSR